MTRKTHIAVGIAATLPLLSVYPKIAIIGIIGSVLPDIDIMLGMLGIHHRTITHSLLALFLTTITVVTLNFNIGIIFGTNYLIHLILDSCTKMGIPLLYPFNKKYYGMKLIYTGGAEDLFICLLALSLIFL